MTVTDAAWVGVGGWVGWGANLGGLRMGWAGKTHLAQELGVFHSPKRFELPAPLKYPRECCPARCPLEEEANGPEREPAGGGRGEGWAGNSVTNVGPVRRSTMVAGTRCLRRCCFPRSSWAARPASFELGRRKFAASAGRSSSQPSDEV